jgi:hypothetical protein
VDKANFFDLEGARQFIVSAIEHYASLNVPPWFIDYLDLDLYVRLGERWATITLDELSVLYRLSDENGWKEVRYAVNDVYKLYDRLGRSTDGLVSY